MGGTTNIQPPSKTQLLYDAVSKDYNVGTYDEFRQKLADPAKRKAFYDGVGKEFNLGSYKDFEQKITGDSVKKKEDTGSPAPSVSSPKLVQTEQPVGTSVSDQKPPTANFKNNSLTAKDVGPVQGDGLTPDLVKDLINNKGIGLQRLQNEPSRLSTQYLLQKQQDLDRQIYSLGAESHVPGVAGLREDKDRMAQLRSQRDFYQGEIQKNYEFEKNSLVPELANQLKGLVDDSEFDPKTHTLRPISAKWVFDKVDAEMNRRNNPIVNAAVSGNLDKKNRNYFDLGRSVLDQLNLIPIQKAQQQKALEFFKDHPQIQAALKANEEVNDYFSHANVNDVKTKVKVDADKSYIQIKDKYYGSNGIMMRSPMMKDIQEKYAQLVHDGKMEDDVARKQMVAEIEQNPELKSITNNYESEVNKVSLDAQKQYDKFLVDGLRKEHPSYTVYSDGTPGLASMPEDQYKKLLEDYRKQQDDVAKQMGAENNEAWKRSANERAKAEGAFFGSLKSSANDMIEGMTKWFFGRTGWGGDNVRWFEAKDVAAPQASQSDVAATWNWKGWESLLNKNFYLSKLGASVPALAGGVAVGVATGGEGVPEYIGWLANAGLFTAQSAFSTYNQILTTKTKDGHMISESDAAARTADQAAKDFLPNVLMMAITSGTLLKAKNIANPTIAGALAKVGVSTAEQLPFNVAQGYTSYAEMKEAQGHPTDFFDYMQSDDFKDNVANAMIMGAGFSLIHAPGQYMHNLKNWQKLTTAEGDFKNQLSQNYALGQEMNGNGNYLRDALKLHTINIDVDGLNDEGKRQLIDLKNTLLYSTNLERNIKSGNLDRTNVNDLYQAHNLALADQHDYLSEQAQKEGNKTLAEVYKDKAKDYREQAKAAANGDAKGYYLMSSEGTPIFLSDKSFKDLESTGIIKQWMNEGTIKGAHFLDDPEFAQRYKDFVSAKGEAEISGKDLAEHGADLIEANKEKLGAFYFVAKSNPEEFFKTVSDQVHGIMRDSDGNPIKSDLPDAEKSAREQYGNDIVDMAKMLYPEAPKVESAVIKIGDKVYEGNDHGEAIEKARQAGEDVSQIDRERDGMFRTSDGRIITREEAMKEFGADHSEQLIKQGGTYAATEGKGKVGEGDQQAGGKEHPRVGAPREEEAQPPADRGNRRTDSTGQEIAPEDNITVSEMLDKKGVYKGQRGTFIQDGQTVIFKPENSNREYELGNINEVGGRSLKDFGIDTEKSVVDVSPEGKISVRGKDYVNPNEDPLKAIVHDKNGNVVAVKLETPDGQRRTFRGQVAEDLAYELTLKQISNEQPAFEQFLNENEGARKEMDNAGISVTPEGETVKVDEPVQREKIEPVKDISSPKIENDEKTEPNAPRSEGKQGGQESQGKGKGRPDGGTGKEVSGPLLTEKEGAEKSAPPAPPLPPSEPRVPKESPKDEFTSVRKERLREIKGAKELFSGRKKVKWTETYQNAMKNVLAMYPDKRLYEAMRSRVNDFVDRLNAGELFNPTSEDIAVFNVLRNETEKRMAEIPGWDSDNNLERMGAVATWATLSNDLYNIARVTNPEGETGRAMYMLQSEANIDPDEGLKLRRMELLAAKGGERLTPEELDESARLWEQERALMQKEADLKQRGMQETFDKQMADVKADYEKQLKTAREGRKLSKAEQREKTLKEKGKDFADRIRGGKMKGDQLTSVPFPGFKQTVNFVIEFIAQAVEKGATLAEAIDSFIKEHGGNKQQFTDNLLAVLDKQDMRAESFEKIKDFAENNGVMDVTNEMVGQNLIRDYINSHVGLHDANEILDVAANQLKTILPDVEKDRLLEAYLKQGDFKQMTKKQLESGFKDAKRQFDKLAKLEKDINDLKNKKDIFRRDSSKPLPEDKTIEAKERERKNLMDSMGIKITGEDKYKKSSYDQRAKSHNDRLNDISKSIEEKLSKGELSTDSEKALKKLKSQLDASGIVLDPTSALSQERTLDGGLSLLKSLQSEFNRNTSGDISKAADIRRSLQKAVDGFDTDKNESEQEIKLKRAKDKAKRDAEMYFKKIYNGEYEDEPVTVLSKTDAELLKLEREKNAIGQIYKNRQKTFQKDNKTRMRRAWEFLRGAEVAGLIGSPITFLKVAGSAVIRPTIETATKLTVGKLFEKIPTDFTKTVSERAKAGGEGSNVKQIERGWKAYLGQYSEDKIGKMYQDASDKYHKALGDFQDQEKEVNRIKYAVGKDTDEYRSAEKKLGQLQNAKNDALVNSVGYKMYDFISGKSLSEGWDVFLHRSTELERNMGNFDREAWDKRGEQALLSKRSLSDIDNWSYLINFFGRSHAALKNFSGRFSFSAGFMARLEYAVQNGVDVSKADKILELANESYQDFERGKYQESNAITDAWNSATNAVERIGTEGSKTRKLGEGLAYLMRADVAITRVPINMLYEGIMEYTLGALTGSWIAGKEYLKAKKIVLQSEWGENERAQFKKELGEQLQKMDADKAAAIVRAYRKGGFGLGIYALAVLGHAAFGGFAHKGQTAEDQKKLKRELETGVPEIKTSEIKIGDWVVPETAAKIMEHAPQLQSALFGLSLVQVYQNKIVDGESTARAVSDDALTHINHIMNSIPMIDKVAGPLAGGAIQSIQQKYASGQWQDVDQNGNPMKRKVFRPSDYLIHLPGFSKKGALSEGYYKQAVATQKAYRDQITEVETNTSLSKEEKAERRGQIMNEMNQQIDEIYRQNEENPE
jgi:hypothetical protein